MSLSTTFKLKDSSSDIEICDPRTDIRALSRFAQPSDLIESKKVKTPEELNLAEVISIYDQIFLRENSWLNGGSLSHAFYDFSFVHDEEILKKNRFVEKLVKYSHTTMHKVYYYVYKMIERGIAKIEDFNVSYIEFLKDHVDDKDADLMMLEVMREFKKKIRKIKSKFFFNFFQKKNMMLSIRLKMLPTGDSPSGNLYSI